VAYRGASPAAPISSIQVRVKGVTGPNALSLARIRLVAEQIAADTGLTVDTTAGSSPTPIRVRLGSGRFGTPPLTLSQGWVREGVDSEIVQAVDAKDVGLLGVALLVSALAIAGAALAAARRRRGEIALLSSLGWTRGRLVGLMLGEVASVSALAGVAALAVAGVLNAAGLLVLSPLEFSLIVIVPFALASVAAVVPSWRAASAPPLEPLTQPVKVSRGRRLTRAIAWFAFANTVRVRGRTILAVISLALGIGAFAAVLGISLAFKGAVAGDLLGNVIVLRTRSADLASVILVAVIGAIALADLLVAGVHERRPEFATLRAVGWGGSEVAKLIVFEGLMIGCVGALLGALFGALLVGLLGGALRDVVVAALLAFVSGCLLSACASSLPLIELFRITTREGLAAE
jgi:putative ABC transport system permease protein